MKTETWRVLPLSARRVHLRISIFLALLACLSPHAFAVTLVGDVFVTGFEGWTDTWTGTPQVGAPPNWGVLLTGDQMLMESSDGRGGDGPAANDGLYIPFIMIDSTNTTPANYTLSASLSTYDNDGLGLVFGYQDNDNYFRVGLREQSDGSVGFPVGTSVQKVVGGVITPLDWVDFVTPFSDGFPFDVDVAVSGANWSVSVDGLEWLAGSDADLQPGNYGVQSWAQKQVDATVPQYGTLVHSIAVASTTLNKTTDFANALSPWSWRPLLMTNAEGAIGGQGEDLGNFRQDFRNGTIQDDTNGYEWATASAPNIDFIGPGVVIDEPGSGGWSNYQMQVRMQNGDNDGIGLLVRVADDDSFYRINFALENMDAAGQRAPRGMSIQKNDNGVWSELYRDDQSNPEFLYTQNTPFDVQVSVVDNAIKVRVIDDPDGAANVINYDPVIDGSNPILAGTVGFTNWGSGDASLGVTFSPFGGNSEILLRTIVPGDDVRLTVDRGSGNMTLTNSGAVPVGIRRYAIRSTAGSLDEADWITISGNYDELANGGDGSVDSDDPWTVTSDPGSDTDFSEAELSGGDGGTIAVNQIVDLGNAWIKSRYEDLIVQIEDADGNILDLEVVYFGDAYARSDLDTDGAITAADWALFYPNTLADLSGLSLVGAALAGDLDLDGDNDVADFAIFKTDFDAQNGAGSFDRMLAGVPEPSSLFLLLMGVLTICGFKRRVGRRGIWFASLSIAMAVLPSIASAVDFTTFVVENYPEQNTFPLALWDATPSTATISPTTANAGANVFYGTESILNQRILGTMVAGDDDDMVGLALGFNAGDTFNLSANFLLMDWKGLTQTFDFVDVPGGGLFHDLTEGQVAAVGLALSRVSGLPTADELWGHVNTEDNIDGGVEELARGATLGATSYPRSGSVSLDIRYTATNVTVLVDGVEELNVDGTFGDGGVGLYTLAQSPPPVFSNFDIVDLDQFLTATVDRGTGEIVLSNESSAAVEFDFYQFDSAGNSLDEENWLSLDEQDYDMTGGGEGQSWDAAGGSDASAIAEMFLQGSSTLLGNESVSIGNAYDTSVDSQDLELSFRLLESGYVIKGLVEYIGEPSEFAADFNGDGHVDGDDFLIWQGGFNQYNGNATMADGDATSDGFVNGDDFLIWQSEFGSGAGSAASAVPEPSAIGLLVLAMAVLAGAVLRR